MTRRFTEEDDCRIRAAWPDVTDLAREMGVLRRSLSARGRRLGLPRQMTHRPFADAELQAIADRYSSEGPRRLARELGRSVGTIVSVAGRLGVRMFTRWTEEENRRFVELRRSGLSHKQIAAEMNRSETACVKQSQSLGLTRPHYDPVAVRQRNLQRRPLGGAGPEARWARERIALGEHGWPPDLNPKEIAILESLRRNGPQERRVLASSIGEPPTRNRKKLLMTHGGVSAMARVMTRGLVARLRMDLATGAPKRGRRMIYVYTLTTTALECRGTYGSVKEFNQALASRGERQKEVSK